MKEQKRILFVDASDMPDDVLDYCAEREIQTHYQNDVALIADSGNPFAEWVKREYGYEFSDNKYGDYIAIHST